MFNFNLDYTCYILIKKLVIVWSRSVNQNYNLARSRLSYLPYLGVNWYFLYIASQKPIIPHPHHDKKDKTKSTTWFYFCHQPGIIKRFYSIFVCSILVP